MKNYMEFVETMKRKVKERMGMEVDVQTYQTTKNNGTTRVGLVIRKADINLSPTIYLEEFYQQYLNGISISELVASIDRLYQQVKLKNSYPYEDVLDFQKIKDKIVYKLVQKSTNTHFLEEVPFETFFDLAVLPYILFEETEFGAATLQIRKEHLLKWNVSEEEVFHAARKNTPRVLPLEMGKLTKYMYVITNTRRNLGASALLYPETLEQAYHMIGENYYILPSSIHEFLLIPQSFGMDSAHLRAIVKEINETEVHAEEVLSDHIYFYNTLEKKIVMKQ